MAYLFMYSCQSTVRTSKLKFCRWDESYQMMMMMMVWKDGLKTNTVALNARPTCHVWLLEHCEHVWGPQKHLRQRLHLMCGPDISAPYFGPWKGVANTLGRAVVARWSCRGWQRGEYLPLTRPNALRAWSIWSTAGPLSGPAGQVQNGPGNNNGQHQQLIFIPRAQHCKTWGLRGGNIFKVPCCLATRSHTQCFWLSLQGLKL